MGFHLVFMFAARWSRFSIPAVVEDVAAFHFRRDGDGLSRALFEAGGDAVVVAADALGVGGGDGAGGDFGNGEVLQFRRRGRGEAEDPGGGTAGGDLAV